MKNFSFFFLLYPLAFFSQTSNVVLHDHWYKDSLITTSDGESIFNEVWGLEHNDENYAVIGSTMGTHILKIVNKKFIEIDFIEGRYAGYQAIHRDYHDFNGYLYAVCGENLSSLQIMDLSYLPDSVHLVYDSDSLIIRAHNIFIDTSKAKLYVCDVDSYQGSNALNVYDLTSPTFPNLLYNYNAVTTVHDAYVYNDTAFLNCGVEGLKVIKSSSSNIPIQIGELSTYLQKGYNHSGWLDIDKSSYVMCDENLGLDVKVLDVSDLDEIKVNAFFSSEMGDDESSIPHNVIVRNNIAYLSYYHDGLQVFDISDPNQPKKLAYYDTYLPNPNVAWAGAWGVYPFENNEFILVSDRKYGLFLLSFEPPPEISDNPFFIFPNPATAYIYFYKEHIGTANYLLNVYNSLGELIDQLNGNSDYYKINLSKYRTGIYILEYISNFDLPSIKTKFFVK